MGMSIAQGGFSQPFTSNYSQLLSSGRMLNNDVSAFLRLQRHSPGSTRVFKNQGR